MKAIYGRSLVEHLAGLHNQAVHGGLRTHSTRSRIEVKHLIPGSHGAVRSASTLKTTGHQKPIVTTYVKGNAEVRFPSGNKGARVIAKSMVLGKKLNTKGYALKAFFDPKAGRRVTAIMPS